MKEEENTTGKITIRNRRMSWKETKEYN